MRNAREKRSKKSRQTCAERLAAGNWVVSLGILEIELWHRERGNEIAKEKKTNKHDDRMVDFPSLCQLKHGILRFHFKIAANKTERKQRVLHRYLKPVYIVEHYTTVLADHRDIVFALEFFFLLTFFKC